MSKLKTLLSIAAEIQVSKPLRNCDRVKAKLEWRKTKWGRRDEWERK